MKKLKCIVIILIIVLVFYFAFRYFCLGFLANAAIKQVTDLDTHMDRVMFDPLKCRITVRGLKIFNQHGFKNKILAKVPLLIMDFSLKTLFEKGIFYDMLVVSIKELNIIRNEDNIVNLSKVKALTPQKRPKHAPPFKVDRYILEMKKVNYIDYTKDYLKEIDLDVKEEYKNIRDSYNIAKLIIYKVFYSGQIGNIGVDIQEIQRDLAKLARENKNLAEELAKSEQARFELTKQALQKKMEEEKRKMDQAKEELEERQKIDQIKEVLKEKVPDEKKD